MKRRIVVLALLLAAFAVTGCAASKQEVSKRYTAVIQTVEQACTAKTKHDQAGLIKAHAAYVQAVAEYIHVRSDAISTWTGDHGNGFTHRLGSLEEAAQTVCPDLFPSSGKQ